MTNKEKYKQLQVDVYNSINELVAEFQEETGVDVEDIAVFVSKRESENEPPTVMGVRVRADAK
ncbi:hypothetical protein [Psychrobacter phage vB_PmaS_Y8A]|nr:hypothetical protein [Psychrobacter phage vB_PmaS_Y8A]